MRDEPDPEPEQVRRVADVFGDVLPSSTQDDMPEPTADEHSEQWLRENEPPHHERG